MAPFTHTTLARTQAIVLDFIRRWRERREEAAIERGNFERTVEEFIADTRPFAPVAAKYPEAALYRHAWKRAVALQEIYQERSDASRATHDERVRKRLASADQSRRTKQCLRSGAASD